MDKALAGQGVAQETEVARAELPFEFMLNALRLKDGFGLPAFSERTGLPPSALHAGLAAAEAAGPARTRWRPGAAQPSAALTF